MSISEVLITAPARLHLGFLDLTDSGSRRFGSIGMAIDTIATRVRVARCAELIIEGHERARAEKIAVELTGELGIAPNFRILVESAIPAHAGLGSGTQLDLAIAAALRSLTADRPVTTQPGEWARRGRRSGIGIATFANGGFVTDGGHGGQTVTPPVLSRLPFPSEWRVVLVFDDQYRGLNGDLERRAFADLAPMASADSATICRAVLMGVLPALAEPDFGAFCAALETVQTLVGNYFAPFQNDAIFTSPRVARALEVAKGVAEISVVGQSSWGPTGFCFVSSASAAQHLVSVLEAQGNIEAGLRFLVCGANNSGATIKAVQGAEQATSV
ncbi:MAG: beta-ribofuranosylaminobenzene 5'-phosphate synthase family protein [Pseudomonadota bacterium]